MAEKKIYKEIRRISATALRSLCIKMNWYTEGNNDEYGHLLFDLADHKPHLDTADIIEIAEDIAAHSELNTAAGEDIGYIAYLLAGIATITFEEQKEPCNQQRLPMHRPQRRKKPGSIIDKLSPELRREIETMLCDGRYSYSDIVTRLKKEGITISGASVCRYAKRTGCYASYEVQNDD